MNLTTYIETATLPKPRRRYKSGERVLRQQKADRQKALEKANGQATERYKPWDLVAEALIMESTKTDIELAKELGRTLDSVRSKRKKLYRMAGVTPRSNPASTDKI
jgi:formylmethanofuran dehydrogenase subunit B